ncbi:hypothetical protein [Salibacterium qingdaonense]|uniref:Uncharacterized protein n=1 Tax=Salibacterium qingdaonense TaxID=266892 RepID=A0A1I4R4S0_9BACI|nr:hypothetical protein [Salibacterium qingdaonense]SFM46930.1 hypothetical protein SAMN04488054_1613 [Salibacterium qingdaonense]
MDNIQKDYNKMLSYFGEDVQQDGDTLHAIITQYSRSPNREYDEYMISSSQKISRGDLITYHESNWLVVSEIKYNGYEYVGFIRHCNYTNEIKVGETREVTGTDSMGRPIFETTPEYAEVKGIIESNSFSIDQTSGLKIPANESVLTVQDNEETRKVELGTNIDVFGRMMQIYGTNRTKIGLLVFSLQRND